MANKKTPTAASEAGTYDTNAGTPDTGTAETETTAADRTATTSDAAAAQPIERLYRVSVLPIRHNGEVYGLGQRIALTDAQASRLVGLQPIDESE